MSEELEVIAREIAAELTDDGDTWELDDGRVVRLKIEHDQDYNLDYADDCYGQLAPVERDRWAERERPRPDGFNGRARKIGTRDSTWWWQPPADIEDGHIARLYELVRAIIDEGFYTIGVELLSGVDAYSKPIVVAAEWLGGVEPIVWNNGREEGRAYYRAVIEEQIVELLTSQGITAADVLGKEDVPMS